MKTRILVVEDEVIVRMDIVERLKSLGYEVAAAVGRGEDALKKLEEERVQLVLMDIILAGEMDGIVCAQEIASRFDIPVVYLTALADSRTLARAKITGPFGYILKPFDERDLQPVIEMALYKHMMERRLRETQEQLIQSGKLAALGSLCSGIAHEIRNPLGIILAGIEYIGMLNVDDPSFQEAIGRVRESVSRANKIIVDLLKFSRFTKTEFSRVDLKKAAADAVSLLENAARSSGILLETRFAAGECVVNGDLSLLRQAFFNLLTNALDACASGDVVSVTIRSDEEEGKERRVVAEVADTGAGIAPELMTKIFDPFFTTKDPGKGTGLGLSITHMILEKHGGTISANSDKQKGSRFTLNLPYASCEPVPSAVADS